MKKTKILCLLLLLCSSLHVAYAQIITTIAGTSTAGYSGDGGSATSATFNAPTYSTFDASGNMYISDAGNNVIRKINTSGIISTFAGTGASGYSGSGGLATSAMISDPQQLVVSGGFLYFCDKGNNRIRKINLTTNVITDFAGTGLVPAIGSPTPYGSHALGWSIGAIKLLAVDPSGNIITYLPVQNVMCTINPSTSAVNKIAGVEYTHGIWYGSGSGSVSPISVPLSSVLAIAVYNDGTIYFSDSVLSFVYEGNILAQGEPRFINSGALSLFATSPSTVVGFGESIASYYKTNTSIAFDEYGHIYLNSAEEAQIVKSTISHTLSRYAGSVFLSGGIYVYTGYSGDGGPARLALLSKDFTISSFANAVYVTDKRFNVVRKIAAPGAGSFTSGISSVCLGDSATITINGGSPGAVITLAPTGSTYSLDYDGNASIRVAPISTTTYTATYTYGTFSGSVAGSATVSVLPIPIVSSPTSVICNYSTTSLSADISGGTWYSSLSSVAYVGLSSGVITPVASGTTTVSYTAPSGCSSTPLPISVSFLPVSTASSAVCQGLTTSASVTGAGAGTWSSSSSAIATVGASSGIIGGVVTGASAPAYATITYTETSTGCVGTSTITVGYPFTMSAVTQSAPFAAAPSDSMYTYTAASTSYSALSLVANGAPSGASYTWSTTPATTTGSGISFTPTFTPTSSIQSYTVQVSASYLGCTSNTRKATVIVPISGCSPYDYFYVPAATGCTGCGAVTPFKTYTNTTISTAPTAGNYYFANNGEITLSGTLNFTDVNICMGGASTRLGSTITTDVVFNHCHLANSCGWRGISFGSGNLKLIGSTLIENISNVGDRVAIYCVNPGTAPLTYNPVTGEGSYVFADGLIINNAPTGMRLGYPSLYSSSTILPFRVKNSVFTRAVFNTYINGSGTSITDYYPNAWPTTSSLKANTSTPGTDAYYYNPSHGLDAYMSSSLAPLGIGIQLDENYTNTTPALDYSFTSNLTVVGDNSSADNYNLFQNLVTGVSAKSNNVIINSVFKANPSRPLSAISSGEYGINADQILTITTPAKYKVIIGLDPTTLTATAYSGNKFYNMGIAIQLIGTRTVLIKNNEISSTKTAVSDVFRGVTTNSHTLTSYDNIDISDNIFRNLNLPCKIESRNSSASLLYGRINITNNQINPVAYTGSTYNAFSKGNAIDVTFPATLSTVPTDYEVVNISNNTLRNVETGIYLTACRKAFQINNNNVLMTTTSGGTATKGIWVLNSPATSTLAASTISGNKIVGPGHLLPNASATDVSAYRTGFLLNNIGSAGRSIDLSCNYVNNTKFGFLFNGTNVVNWDRNVMQTNRVGLFLSNSSIGEQGVACAPLSNRWLTSSGFTWSTGSGNYHTYTSTINPAVSPVSILHVWSGTDFAPTVNGTTGGGTAYTTSGSTPSLDVITSTASCSSAPSAAADRCDPNASGAEGWKPGETIAQSGVEDKVAPYVLFPNPNTGAFQIKQSDVKEEEVSIKVYNSLGAVVYEQLQNFQSGMVTVDINTMPVGIYIVELYSTIGERTVFRMLKN